MRIALCALAALIMCGCQDTIDSAAPPVATWRIENRWRVWFSYEEPRYSLPVIRFRDTAGHEVILGPPYSIEELPFSRPLEGCVGDRSGVFAVSGLPHHQRARQLPQ